MRLTLWLTMSCNSLAIRSRSAAIAVRAALSRSRSSNQPRSPTAFCQRRRVRASATASHAAATHATPDAAAGPSDPHSHMGFTFADRPAAAHQPRDAGLCICGMRYATRCHPGRDVPAALLA